MTEIPGENPEGTRTGTLQRAPTDGLYELLPDIYRMRDAEQGYPLQALLRVIAEQVGVVEDDIDQLYENWFIETCQDWAIPYLGDLVGYRLPPEILAPSAQSALQALAPNLRQAVANAIRSRRRKGTLALLEELANDVSGWPSRAVEFYKLLGLDQFLNSLHLGRGRLADLHSMDALERVDGAFDELAHSVDVRRINSPLTPGRYNIPSVGVYLWRLKPYSVTRAPAYCVDRVRHHYTFSILGNDTPLMTLPVAEAGSTQVAGEMNVPAWIRRRAFYERKADYYGSTKSLYIWRDGSDKPVPIDDIVPADLSQWAYRPTGNQVVVDPRLGRIAFAPRRAPKKGVWVTYHYGFSADTGGGEYDRPVDEAGAARLYRISQSGDVFADFETLNAALEQWQKDAPPRAVLEILDSGVYSEQIDIQLAAGQRLEMRAADGVRPVIRLLDWYSNRPDAMRITGLEPANDEQQPVPHPAEAPRLILDGLLIAGRSVVVSGLMGCVAIRHTTLVPGWTLDAECHPENESEPSLELNNTNAEVVIEYSILGTILVDQDEVWTDPLEVRISDSVLDATRPELPALSGLEGRHAHVNLTARCVTAFGEVLVHAVILAENSIFNDPLRVARRQIGCVRYSYVHPESRTPQRHQCQPDGVVQAVAADFPPGEERRREQDAESQRVRPRFNSVRYGTPTYCQLSECCAEEIVRGADDGSEMGAYHDLYQPQRQSNLRASLEEFTPAGMDVGLIFET